MDVEVSPRRVAIQRAGEGQTVVAEVAAVTADEDEEPARFGLGPVATDRWQLRQKGSKIGFERVLVEQR